MDKTSFFILNVFLNSIFAFFTAVLLIEMIIFLFRIKQGRIAAILRMIPILKLPLDLFLYDFSRWSYLQGINPLNCKEGTRTLSVLFGWINSPSDWLHLPINSAIQFTLPGNITFTLSDLIGHMVNPLHLKIFTISFVFLSACFFIKKVVVYQCYIKSLNSIATHSEPITKKLHNHQLMAQIRKGKYPIFASSLLQGSPFVAGLLHSIIYVPTNLSQYLSRKEYEAVLAHEIEHIRHRDVFIRFILDIISSIFWWVPIKWLQNRIEEGQEISCDYQCKKYGVDFVDLASAICKSAKYAKNYQTSSFAHHFTKHKTLKRVNMLVQSLPRRFQKTKFLFACLAITIAFLLILFGRFWMF
jgi:beta-lactamase regulating signal transducer with metallopeptidase domain